MCEKRISSVRKCILFLKSDTTISFWFLLFLSFSYISILFVLFLSRFVIFFLSLSLLLLFYFSFICFISFSFRYFFTFLFLFFYKLLVSLLFPSVILFSCFLSYISFCFFFLRRCRRRSPPPPPQLASATSLRLGLYTDLQSNKQQTTQRCMRKFKPWHKTSSQSLLGTSTVPTSTGPHWVEIRRVTDYLKC